MAHDFTRNIKHLTIEQISDNFLNNFTDTNDLVSDDNKNYIKKPDEKFHCLTDNIKTIENADVNDENNLLTIINENDTKNKATLQVLHDLKKENRLTSTDNSISIISQVENINYFTNINVNEEWLNQHIQTILDNDFRNNYTLPSSLNIKNNNNNNIGVMTYTQIKGIFYIDIYFDIYLDNVTALNEKILSINVPNFGKEIGKMFDFNNDVFFYQTDNKETFIIQKNKGESNITIKNVKEQNLVKGNVIPTLSQSNEKYLMTIHEFTLK